MKNLREARFTVEHLLCVLERVDGALIDEQRLDNFEIAELARSLRDRIRDMERRCRKA